LETAIVLRKRGTNEFSAVIEINWTLTRTDENGKGRNFVIPEPNRFFGRLLDRFFVDLRTGFRV
jgi:hypothetical protein